MVVNLERQRGKDWVFNQKFTKKEMEEFIIELMKKKIVFSELEVIDLYKKNPNFYKKPYENYQVRYK